jgi:hypothetical protein
MISNADPGAVACTIYLLAAAHSADLAAAAGWHALDIGCDDDQVIIALADILLAVPGPARTSAALLHARLSDRRSTAFLIKLADHYWTGGRAWMAEAVLTGVMRRGRTDVMLRLADHWVETKDWRSARDLLRQFSPDQQTPYALYLLGRCGVSLLLEDDVVACIDALRILPEPAPAYADLLQSVWEWRVGDPWAAVQRCPEGDFPPLLTRDAVCLRRATVTQEPHSAGVWRVIGFRDDLPNVLGIGMQRSGTSWLWKQLGRHPDVQARTFKELMFFSDPFDAPQSHGSDLREASLGEAAELYLQGPTRSLRRYRRIFADAKPVRIDMSPDYAELPSESVQRIRNILGPDVKIILSVRDPVERSWSNLKFDLMATGEHPNDLGFSERAALYRSLATMRRCDYATVLDTWSHFFSSVKVIFVDDMIERPCQLLAELGNFIGFSSPLGDAPAAPVNVSPALDMPRDDRLFLFGLHQPTYDAAEAALGGPALGWRQRQLALLGGA